MDCSRDSLVDVYELLNLELKKGITEWKQNVRCSNASEIRNALVDFVAVLQGIPECGSELHRRATWIGDRCGPGSDYEKSRARAQDILRKQCKRLQAVISPPKKNPTRNPVLENLRSFSQRPLYLHSIEEERKYLSRVDDSGAMGWPDVLHSSLSDWRNVCDGIIQDALGLQVDGCFYMQHVHEAAKNDPSELSQCIGIVLASDMIGPDLVKIQKAVDSIFQFAKKCSRSRADTYSSKLVGNRIDDPTAPLTASQLAKAVWGKDGDALRKRIREWLKRGKLPANLADGLKDHYVVSASALDRLAKIEGGTLSN